MKSTYFYMILFSLLLLWGCSDKSSDSSEEEKFGDWVNRIELPDDMIFVGGREKLAVLGTKDSAAQSKERPEMKVELTYEYYLGKHEVSCDQFYSLMKKVASEDCGDKPVVNVTYYDAVLYANERSKEADLDTAYSYNKLYLDANGHCTKIEGLYFNPYAESYRLPSEAEWMYVAARHWNVKDSWYGSNSENERHDVCTSKPDADGFCDLSGNVMEWMNEWLAVLQDTTLKNFAGASDGGALDERVVKGGSFHHDSSAIRIYKRGDVYTVSSNSRASYVGFRLAFGPMYLPMWLGSDGSRNDTDVKSKSDMGTIREITGAFQAEIAFRNDITGNLIFGDYTKSGYALHEFKDTMQVYHPEISPNGANIAFCTKPEGVSGKSELFVRNIHTAGTVKLDVESAAIPRWRVLPSGDTVIVYVTDAGSNKEEFEWKNSSTWQVPFNFGEFGTPEKLLTGSFNGGVSDDDRLAVSGARLLRTKMSTSKEALSIDSIWYNEEQACNVSLSKDKSKRTLFLDFASGTGQKYAGTKYSTHGRLFVADSTGKLIYSMPAPKGYTFDHTEWVVNANEYMGAKSGYVIATLADKNGVHGKIALLNLADSSVTTLVEGEELWHPSLWIKKIETSSFESLDKSLDLDSAGYYYHDAVSSLLSQKMNVFWQLHDSLKIVCLGSSRMTGGVWTYGMKNGMGLNLGALHVDMDVIHYVAQNYALPHAKKMRYLIVSLDLDLWGESFGVNLKENLVPEIAYAYDKNHKFWKDGIPDGFIDINKVYLQESPVVRDYRRTLGWQRYEVKGWESSGLNSSALVADSTWSDHVKTYKDNMSKLEDIIAAAKKNDVVVVGVVFPQSPYYKKTGAFGRHGMRRSLADSLLKELKSWESEYSNFKFVDENKMGKHDYTDDDAFDYDHLSFKGAKKLTARLDSLMNSWDEADE